MDLRIIPTRNFYTQDFRFVCVFGTLVALHATYKKKHKKPLFFLIHTHTERKDTIDENIKKTKQKRK